MAKLLSLDGVTLFVSSTADNGVVGGGTRIALRQQGARVIGRYRGGAIRRGVLVGGIFGATLEFRYLQVEASGEIHGGRSGCDLVRTPEGRIRIVEHFTWTTREGGGTNVFDELPS